MKLKIIAVVLAVISLAQLGYVISQKPQVWWNQEWAGICFTRGAYRSWTMRFCDGRAFIDGQWKPVVVTSNGLCAGTYAWPKFSHVDMTEFERSFKK